MMNAWPYQEVTWDELVAILHEEVHDTMTHYGGSRVKAFTIRKELGLWSYSWDASTLELHLDLGMGVMILYVFDPAHEGRRFGTLDSLLRRDALYGSDPMISAAIEIWGHLQGNTYKVSSSAGLAPRFLTLDVETFWEQEVRMKFESLPQRSRIKLWKTGKNQFVIEHAWTPLKPQNAYPGFDSSEQPQPYVSVSRGRGATFYPITPKEMQDLPAANWHTIGNDLREVQEVVHTWCF